MGIIGFLGPRGTFTEAAARQYVAALRAGFATETRRASETLREEELRPYDDIPRLLAAVANAEIGTAIVPVENSIEGTVNVTIDMLIHEVDVPVIGEVVLPIRHNLLLRTGYEKNAVHTVISHPQALAQCRRYLDTHLPGVTVEAALSTAAAAARAETAPGGIAAIGNELCARLYDLTVVASDIQDESNNATRFFVVGRTKGAKGEAGQATVVAPAVTSPTEDRYKTSVAFAFASDGPGNLYGALGEFAHHGVNLTKLESRPARQALGHYIFLADMEGRADEPSVAAALHALRADCTFVKVLGSYRRVDEIAQ